MEKPYENILITVDGSEPSKNAFYKSIEMANRHDAKLFIMHAVDTRPYRGIQIYDVNFSKKAKEHGEALVSEREEEAAAKGVKDIKTFVAEDAPKNAIIKYINKNTDIDIVICGATGINAVERMLLGSVATHVIRHARCDVLVVKNN